MSLAVKLNPNDFEDGVTIGIGTFGRVLLVRNIMTNEYCAMKALAKARILKMKQVEHVKSEKDILVVAQHPFIVSLLGYTQDDLFLYLYFEYILGGELFTYLRTEGRFSNYRSMFYTAQIVLALDFLHNQSIVYRDLKPENLLLDIDGNIKITDFGFAKKVTGRTWTVCGTPEYIAPEIIQNQGHSFPADWWSLGVLIYEMIVGQTPFFTQNTAQLYEKILTCKIAWPPGVDAQAKDLIQGLLVVDKTQRLGNMKNGVADIKNKEWFSSINWDDLINGNIEPPFAPPPVSGPGDTRNFQAYDDENWRQAVPPITGDEQKMFVDF